MNNDEFKTFVLLSLGSNLGDKKSFVEKAVKLLKESGIIENVKISRFYSTEPYGYKNQPWFVNVAVAAYTSLSLGALMAAVKSIEYDLGRRNRGKWREREIDIDILMYGETSFESPELTVPHSLMHKRKFVLAPAAEIAGNAVHPKLGLTISELLERCSDDSRVVVLP